MIDKFGQNDKKGRNLYVSKSAKTSTVFLLLTSEFLPHY